MSYFGLIGSLPAGFLTRWLGPRVTAVFAMVISGGSYLLVWSSTLNTSFYQDNFLLLVLYFFMAGTNTVKTFCVNDKGFKDVLFSILGPDLAGPTVAV